MGRYRTHSHFYYSLQAACLQYVHARRFRMKTLTNRGSLALLLILITIAYFYARTRNVNVGGNYSETFQRNLGKNFANHTLSSLPTSLIGKRILVGRLWAMSSGGQLGNQVYEVLSFVAIAKTLNRQPVIIFGDEFNYNAEPQFWNLIVHFPNVLYDVNMYVHAEFHVNSWPQIVLKQCAFCFHDFQTIAHQFDNEDVVVAYAEFLQNYKYLELLGRSDFERRLSFPSHTSLLAKNIVPLLFHLNQKRLCVHSRRTDFVKNKHQYTTDEWMLKAIKNITCGNASLFSIVLFGDDRPFLESFIKSPSYSQFTNSTYLPRPPSDKIPDIPVHFIWLFMKDYCTHILLTASTSTFGFLGAYLAGDNAVVYYNFPIANDGKTGFDMPPRWKLLDF